MMNATLQSETPAASVAAPTQAGRAGPALRSMRAALQWRLLLLWTAALLLPAAIATVPVLQLLSASLSHSVQAAALAAHLDLNAISDLAVANARAGTGIGNAGLLALVFTLLLSPLLSGMTIQAARSAGTPGFGALFSGGVQEYPRLLRMLAWAIVPLGIAGAIAAGAFAAAHAYAGKAVFQSEAGKAWLAASCLAALLFVIADASLDAGRAVLASDRRRTSAVKAWWQGCKLLLRHPLKTLGIYLGITLAGLGVAGMLALVRLNATPLGIVAIPFAFLVTQLAVAALGWMRSARLFAMLELIRPMR
jgi:hypothetical protein